MKTHILQSALLLFLSLIIFQTNSAQTPPPPVLPGQTPSPIDIERRAREINNERGGKDQSGMISNRIDMKSFIPELYKGKSKEAQALRKQFDTTRHLLMPGNERFEEFKDLIKRKMRLLRLQEDKHCNFEGTISVENLERCSVVVPIYGNGSYYSFQKNAHYFLQPISIKIEDNITLINKAPKLGFTGMGDWWDLHFSDGVIETGEALLQDITQEIGGSRLESFTLNSSQLKLINEYKDEKETGYGKFAAIAKNKQINAYPNSAPAKVGNTYIFHSLVKDSGKKKSDKATLTILFKIVAQETDKSLIILWRKLKNK